MCYFTCQAQQITISSGFNLMAGGIITHSFITCKLRLKQSGKVPQPVL